MTSARRRRGTLSSTDKPEITIQDRSPLMAYRDLVSHSSAHFRADVEFHEQPRQIVTGAVLIVMLGLISRANSEASESYGPAVRTTFLGLTVLIVFYCMLHTKDGLMIRPHPMLWRAVHGAAFSYVIFLGIVMILPNRLGISFVHDLLMPDIAGGAAQVFSKQQIALVRHLDPSECAITFSNVFRQVTSIYFFAHVFGWWGKMCLLRDWSMCLQYSVTFELVELSLVWLIPEFEECWWDSIVMDMLGANMLGLLLGSQTLRWLACRSYDWEPFDKNKPLFEHFRVLIKKFTPFSWSDYYWPNDPKCWILSSVAWIGALVLEVNSFIVLHALVIRPSHWFNIFRLCLLGAQGAQSVPEWYEYVRGNTERIGHNTWLVLLIIALELMIGLKYGRGGVPYDQTRPPWKTVACIGTFAVLWIVWYSISAYRSFRGERRSPNWLVGLHVLAFTPLIFLSGNWII